MATQKGRNWSSGDIVTAANLSSIERGVSAVAEEYTPTTWANGNTVTAAALNNIEQGIVNADGGGPSWVTLCEEEVTTEENQSMYEAPLSYSQLISADTIRVIFDETTYICNIVNQRTNITYYGGAGETGPDFSEYPFALISKGSSGGNLVFNTIYTEVSGTHTVKIEALQESGNSSDFSTAQVTIINNEQFFVLYFPNIFDNQVKVSLDSSDIDGSPVEAVLYTGVCHITYTSDDTLNISVTGNATISGKEVIVTGDCTITISDESSGGSPK